jgi:acetyl esterase/lipase
MRMPLRNKVRVLILWTLPLLAHAGDVPRDTSFTITSAIRSVTSKYPAARLVLPDSSLAVVLHPDFVYAVIGERKLHLDLFTPRNPTDTSCPCVIMIHGGGWRSGNRSMEHAMARRLADRGYVVASIEYGLSGEAKYPAAVHDINAAIRWMKAHAAEYRGDRSRIALYGESAGGHLAALTGVTSGIRFFDGVEGDSTISTKVQAIVDVDGILDFTHPAESGKDTGSAPPSAGKRWLGASYRDAPELWSDASPMKYAGAQTPPIAFINSSQGRFHAGRDSMIARLRVSGRYSEVHTLPDSPHMFWMFAPWFDPTMEYIDGFLRRVFTK